MSDDDEEGARVIPFRGGDPDYVPPPIPAYADEPAPTGDIPEPPAFPTIPPRPAGPPVIPPLPPLPDPMSALHSSDIPAPTRTGEDSGEFGGESGGEIDGEFSGSLADRFADWIDYRVAVGQARLEEEKPYREAKIAAKAAKLQARTEARVARLQANTKLRQAYGKGKSDLAAARSTGADRGAGRGGGLSRGGGASGGGGRSPGGGRSSGAGGLGGNRSGSGGGSGRSPSPKSAGGSTRSGGQGRGPGSGTGPGGSGGKSGSGGGGIVSEAWRHVGRIGHVGWFIRRLGEVRRFRLVERQEEHTGFGRWRQVGRPWLVPGRIVGFLEWFRRKDRLGRQIGVRVWEFRRRQRAGQRWWRQSDPAHRQGPWAAAWRPRSRFRYGRLRRARKGPPQRL
ncbi:hypothetical protein ACU686_12680 [Yinghuangia aomiensis]